MLEQQSARFFIGSSGIGLHSPRACRGLACTFPTVAMLACGLCVDSYRQNVKKISGSFTKTLTGEDVHFSLW